MSHGLGRDGWPSDDTVIRNRDAEIKRLRADLKAAKMQTAHDEECIEELKAECNALRALLLKARAPLSTLDPTQTAIAPDVPTMIAARDLVAAIDAVMHNGEAG